MDSNSIYSTPNPHPRSHKSLKNGSPSEALVGSPAKAMVPSASPSARRSRTADSFALPVYHSQVGALSRALRKRLLRASGKGGTVKEKSSIPVATSSFQAPSFTERREDPEKKMKSLNAEINNGRLAMFAIIGTLTAHLDESWSCVSPLWKFPVCNTLGFFLGWKIHSLGFGLGLEDWIGEFGE